MESSQPTKKVKRDSPNQPANVSNTTSNGVQSYTAPDDWPTADRPIDLTVHDHAHASSDTEWWYVNTHCTSTVDTSKQYAVFASFFRIIQAIDPVSHVKQYAHALCYCIADIHQSVYASCTLLDHNADTILKHQLENDVYNIDYRFKQALLEILAKRSVPLPDIKMKRAATCSMHNDDADNTAFKLDYDGNTLSKTATGSYQLQCKQADRGIAIDLTITSVKPVIRQAYDGVVKVGLRKDTMYYYFIPRCSVTGSVTLSDNIIELTGTAWYDHEFGGTFRADLMIGSSAVANGDISDGEHKLQYHQPTTNGTHSDHYDVTYKSNGTNSKHHVSTHQHKAEQYAAKRSYAWNWLSIQLDNDMDVTVTQLIDIDAKHNERVFQQYAITIDSQTNNYKRSEHHDIKLSHSRPFVSLRTTNSYPLDWHVEIDDAGLALDCTACIDDQEIVTLISKPAFYEGVMQVTGTMHGVAVTGHAWLERQGFNEMNTLENFFRNMGNETIHVIDEILPAKPSYTQARELIATVDHDAYMAGVNLDIYSKTIAKPLRDIIDRGGKSWRSLACLLCVDAVGGHSSRYRHWLAMPEIMHVGSLIIDDIQDESTHRRGGDACHIMYGTPLAINTGCAAYFLSLNILNKMTPDLTADTRLKLYEYYFLGLRAGHTGQGFDLYGLDYLMDGVVDTGANTELVQAILCTHRLKSAVPAGCLARMGAVIGSGTQQQTETLGSYFESIGLAFQIIDDVLNINGFEANKKDRCEDIKAGKITYPIAVAMSRTMLKTSEQRRRMWQSIQGKPSDDIVIDEIVKTLNDCGAIDASMSYATKLVNDAWKQLDANLSDSFYKMVLRAFGLYVLERKW